MKKFTTSLKGYNISEVNEFVDKVTKEYEMMLSTLKERDEEISRLKQANLKYSTLESTLNKAMMVASDTSLEIKRVARDEAKSIIEEANLDASKIVNEALMKSNKIKQEIDELKRQIIVYKNRYKSILDEQKDIIKRIEDEYE